MRATKYHMQLTIWHIIIKIRRKMSSRSQAADTLSSSLSECKNLCFELGRLHILQMLEGLRRGVPRELQDLVEARETGEASHLVEITA